MTCMATSLCLEDDSDGCLDIFGSIMLELLDVSTLTEFVCLIFLF